MKIFVHIRPTYFVSETPTIIIYWSLHIFDRHGIGDSARPLDDDTLDRKFDIFFQTVKKIHVELIKIFPHPEAELIASQFLYDSSYGFYESHILNMLKTFEEYGLSRDAEPVIDLWKIS